MSNRKNSKIAETITISVNADSPQDAADLITMLKHAGVESPEPSHADMPVDSHDDMVNLMGLVAEPEADSDTIHTDIDSHNIGGCSTCGGDHGEDTPCGMADEDVDEEWDNSPDEEYKDDNFMVHDMGNDLHRKKDRRAIRTVHPALESQLKTSLRQEWETKKHSS